MIKKHQKRFMYATYSRTSLKQQLNKAWNQTRKSQIFKKTCVLIYKVLNVVQLLIQSYGETYCCCYNLFANMTEISAVVNLWQRLLSLSNKKRKISSKKNKLVSEASLRCHTFC